MRGRERVHVTKAICGHQGTLRAMTKAISGPPAGARTLSNTGIGITTPKGVRFVKSKLKCVVIA